MDNEWTDGELAQLAQLIRYRERRRMEELHNDIVGVIVKHRATPQASLMVLRLLEQEITNDSMIKFFAPKPAETISPSTPKDIGPGEGKEAPKLEDKSKRRQPINRKASRAKERE